MREKAKELQRQKLEAVKKGGKTPVFSTGTGFGSNTGGYNPVSNIESLMLRGKQIYFTTILSLFYINF